MVRKTEGFGGVVLLEVGTGGTALENDDSAAGRAREVDVAHVSVVTKTVVVETETD